MTEPILDKQGIIAEIHRNGETLQNLSLKNGLAKSSCSAALHVPVPAANQAIAKFIGRTVHDLWPDWYHEDGTRIPSSGSKVSRTKSQIEQDVA